MSPSTPKPRVPCGWCSRENIVNGRGGSIPEWALVQAFRENKPCPTCRVCKAKYTRPAKSVFDKYATRADQAADGRAAQGRANVQHRGDEGKGSGKAKGNGKLQQAQQELAEARKQIQEMQLAASKASSAGGAAGSSGGERPAADEAPAEGRIATLDADICTYEKRLREETDEDLQGHIRDKIKKLTQERTELRIKRDAGKPFGRQYQIQESKVEKAKGAWDRAQAKELECAEAVRKAQAALEEAKQATAEAAGRHQEETAHLAKLAAQKAAAHAEPQPDFTADIRTRFTDKFGAVDPKMEECLAYIQACASKKDAEDEAKKAAAKQLPPDEDAEMGEGGGDNLPALFNVEQLAWLNRKPVKQPNQTDEQFDTACREWMRSDPTPAAPPATPAEGARGRPGAKDSEKESRERSRSSKSERAT